MNDQSLSPYRERLDELLAILRQGSLAVLLVDLSALSQVEQDYGADAYDRVLDSARGLISALRGSILREDDVLTSSDVGGDAFLVFLSIKRMGGPLTVAEPQLVAQRVEEHLNSRIGGIASPYLRRRLSVTVGHGLIVDNPLVMAERQISRLVQSAWEAVQFRRLQLKLERRAFLQDLLLAEKVATLYQPIQLLATGDLMGIEALSRGPVGSKYRSPLALFELAAECDLVFELDRLCRRKALANARNLPRDVKLFVNVLPSCMYDPDFSGENLIELLEPLGLAPDRIALEVTEACAIDNYALFGEAVQSLTQLGFSIAVDDIGAGHSGLEKVAKVKPRYLKFDRSLVQGIDTSYVRREMVRALSGFAEKMGSTIIAEGIERPEERDVLLELGIEYGQGYLLGRPAPFAEVTRTEAPATG